LVRRKTSSTPQNSFSCPASQKEAAKRATCTPKFNEVRTMKALSLCLYLALGADAACIAWLLLRRLMEATRSPWKIEGDEWEITKPSLIGQDVLRNPRTPECETSDYLSNKSPVGRQLFGGNAHDRRKQRRAARLLQAPTA
jgi:hypothetical protein